MYTYIYIYINIENVGKIYPRYKEQAELFSKHECVTFVNIHDLRHCGLSAPRVPTNRKMIQLRKCWKGTLLSQQGADCCRHQHPFSPLQPQDCTATVLVFNQTSVHLLWGQCWSLQPTCCIVMNACLSTAIWHKEKVPAILGYIYILMHNNSQ